MGDPELEAMSAVAAALAELEMDARGRVLRWAAERYGIVLGSQSGTHGGSGGGGEADEDDTETQVDTELSAFEHFAELYDAAGPRDKEEKLLVAAYWRQRIQGQASFQALELNRDLKDLGHQVDHISEAFAASTRKRPALILQLRKSGNSQQARKTYKLSGEGVKAVEELIRSNR